MSRRRLLIGWMMVVSIMLSLPVITRAELPPVESADGVALPAVPPSVATAAVEAAKTAREQLEVEDDDVESLAKGADTHIAIEVTPGTTELLRIARGYLNRLITPFEDPRVLTVNAVKVRKEGASIFLATSSEQPVGVHILSNDPEDTRGISLTLVPARIPPKTIELKWRLASREDAPRSPSPQAKRWEQSSPYVEKLLELTQLVARGEVPPGYSLTSSMSGEVNCHSAELTFEWSQRLTGARFSVLVSRVTNRGASAIELTGNVGCNMPGLALVAPWPHAHLAPNAATELYVVVINEAFESEPSGQHRPSLLEREP